MGKQVVYSAAARLQLLEGVNAVANAVKVTIGPKGRNAVIGKENGNPMIINDGVSIAKEVELTQDNFTAVMDYGQRFFVLARLTDKNDKDVLIDDELAMPYYLPDHDSYMLMSDREETLLQRIVNKEKMSAWLVGTACQVVKINHPEDENVTIKLIGIDPLNDKKCICMSDMLAFYNYTLTLLDGVGALDDISLQSPVSSLEIVVPYIPQQHEAPVSSPAPDSLRVDRKDAIIIEENTYLVSSDDFDSEEELLDASAFTYDGSEVWVNVNLVNVRQEP